MAISLQGANLAYQQLRQYLDTRGASVQSVAVGQILKALKLYLTTYGGNPQLQVIPVNGTYSASDGGNNASQVLADATCVLYGVFLYKLGSTEAVFKLSNHNTTASTNGTQDMAIAKTKAGWVAEVYPDGKNYTTGITVTENTDRTGSTLTLVANRMDGFVIIGSPNTAV